MSTAVVDTTVLSNFAHIEKSELLAAAFAELFTTDAVQTELQVGVAAGRIPDVSWNWMGVVELTPAERTKSDQLGETLGRGEAECIAVASARGWIVLTDDRNARRIATSQNITVSGTLGALVNLVRAQSLSLEEADEYLTLMKSRGYHSPIESLFELIQG